MIRALALLVSLVVVFAFCSPDGTRAEIVGCHATDDAAGIVTALPHVGAALKPGSTLRVLAIGSASIFGPEASLAPGTVTDQATRATAPTSSPSTPVVLSHPSSTAFPQEMARIIEAYEPGVKVALTVRGGRGLSAQDQLQLLRDGLKLGNFALVIWQTGTVEAVRNLPPSEFAQTLTEGAELVERSSADLVLIDPQFSRFLQTNSNIEPYEQAFQQLSSLPGVLLFHRFELMRNWVNDGRIDLERTPKADRKRAVEQLHKCLGEQLARIILSGARY